MSAPSVNFPQLSIDERDRRWQAARALMDEHDVDALLVFSDRDGAGGPLWATDHWLINDRVGAYILFPRSGVPIAHVWSANSMVDHMEASARGEQVWLAADQFRMGRNGESLVTTIEEAGLTAARFGVVGVDRMMPFFPDGIVPWGTYQGILDALPGSSFTPVGDAYSSLVLKRSDEELEMVRKSAANGEKMCAAAVEATRVGGTDADVLAALTATGIRAGSWAWWTIMSAGEQDISWGAPSWVYRGGGPREIRSGDVLLLELMPFYGIYESQQQLAIAVGEVHPDVARGAEVAEAAYEVGVQAMREGVATFGELDAAMTSVITAAGGYNSTPNVHTLPHVGVGSMGPREDQEWTKPYRDLGERSRNPTGGAGIELQPGMVYAMQPNCVFDRRRVNVGGTVISTSNGIEELNDIPLRLIHVDR